MTDQKYEYKFQDEAKEELTSLGEDHFLKLSLIDTNDYVARLTNLQYTYGLTLDIANQVEFWPFTYFNYLRNESYRNEPSSITLSNELHLTERNGY